MDDGSEGRIPALVAELDGPLDEEHPDVSVTEDVSSWCISAFQGGKLVFENIEESDIEPRHLLNVSRVEMVRIMSMLARGEIDAIRELEWIPGYG